MEVLQRIPAQGTKVINAPAKAPQLANGTSLSGGRASGSGVLLALFMVLLLLPISFEVGGMRLSPYRILLLFVVLPLILHLFSGRNGRVNMIDACVAGFGALMVVTLVYHHGVERLPYSVIVAVEMLGGYLVGRCLIAGVADYRRFIRYFLVVLAVLAPFAVYELLYSRMLIADVFSSVFSVTRKNQEFRMGFSRVQVVFPHSIHFGLFCSLGLASVYYIYRNRFFQMVPRFVLVLAMTLMSLSSAPLLSAALQICMIIWDKVTRASWRLLAGLSLGAYTFLELFSNRGAVVLLIETLTLSPRTGWWRIHIWTHGSRSVLNHPIMGIGLNDWVRPTWLASTVDNFWLVIAMRHGLIAAVLLCLAFALHFAYVLRARSLDQEAKTIRTGYAITLSGLVFVLSTVHVWNEMAVFVMFFLGAGSFLYASSATRSEPSAAVVELDVAVDRSVPYSRFATRPRATRDDVHGQRRSLDNRIGKK